MANSPQTGYHEKTYHWATSTETGYFNNCKIYDFFSLNILITYLLYRIKGKHTF